MKELYLGTTNSKKVEEFSAILKPLGISVIPIDLDVPEIGSTFVENAKGKALAYAEHINNIVVSEDSGIAIPFLGGLPGLWSARFADLDIETKVVTPSGRGYEEMCTLNVYRVLSLMEDVKDFINRVAFFKAALVVAKPNEVLFESSVSYMGYIANEPKGSNGFAYDKIFVGHNTAGKTLAEIDPYIKNRISHRRKVLDNFIEWIHGGEIR